MSNYYEWSDFKDIYLEDSYVLGIEESDTEFIFIVEMVLKENHPRYTSPNPGEQYCYKKGKIVFQELESIEWISRNTQLFTDANDSEDYGNIDLFNLSIEGYHLVGDWGEVKVHSAPVIVLWSK